MTRTARDRSTERGGLLACALAAAAAGLSPLATPPPEAAGGQQLHVRGEYSLAVTTDSGRLTARWLSESRVRGVLEARARGRTVHRDTTAAGVGHAVSFPAPDADRLTLRFGNAGSDSLHEVTLRLGEEGRGRQAKAVFGARDSLWVVGDVHGHYDRLRKLLENAGLVDGTGRWSGGDGHLVLLGDLMDRGPYVTRTLWFLYRLQDEAREAGGRVSVVLGNHEIMVLTGDHRYVSAQERLLARRHGLGYGEMYHPRRSVLGRWLLRQPAALRVGDVLLVHGGIGPAYLDRSVRELNDSLGAFVAEDLFAYWSDSTVEVTPRDSATVMRRVRFFFEDESPFWYRGYAQTDSAGSALQELLGRRDARLHVIAHTPVPRIRASYGDSVILADLESPAAEMLLLERRRDGYRGWVYGTEGAPRRLGEAPRAEDGTDEGERP